ncbi:MAG: hypothetical protein U9P44_01515, partial [archaeon]|nr:hypothetical protein [archaeon]
DKNRITNIPAPTANSDAATKGYVDASVGAAGGSESCESGWDTSNFRRIGSAIFTKGERTTKIIGIFTKTELVCNFGDSSNPTILIKAEPPQSNPATYQPLTSSGVANAFLIKQVDSSATEDLLIWSRSGSSCCGGDGGATKWSYGLYLKGDGTLSLSKLCSCGIGRRNHNNALYTHFICYER